METSEAWDKGYKCCEKDHPITYNRYRQGTEEYKEFEAGWITRFNKDYPFKEKLNVDV